MSHRLHCAGKDATDEFSSIHSQHAWHMLDEYIIGELTEEAKAAQKQHAPPDETTPWVTVGCALLAACASSACAACCAERRYGHGAACTAQRALHPLLKMMHRRSRTRIRHPANNAAACRCHRRRRVSRASPSAARRLPSARASDCRSGAARPASHRQLAVVHALFNDEEPRRRRRRTQAHRAHRGEPRHAPLPLRAAVAGAHPGPARRAALRCAARRACLAFLNSKTAFPPARLRAPRPPTRPRARQLGATSS